MAKVNVHYYEQEGVQNTETTLEAVKQRASELGIKQVVVATTTGQMALKCAEEMPDVQVVGVLMHAVDYDVYVKRPSGKMKAPSPEILEKARKKGATFYQGVHSLLGGVDSAIRDKFGGLSPVGLISHAYLSISTGTKVAVESTMMAADGGLLKMDEDVIAMGGYRGGADTALVIKPAFTHQYFSLRVREFICLPRQPQEK